MAIVDAELCGLGFGGEDGAGASGYHDTITGSGVSPSTAGSVMSGAGDGLFPVSVLRDEAGCVECITVRFF